MSLGNWIAEECNSILCAFNRGEKITEKHTDKLKELINEAFSRSKQLRKFQDKDHILNEVDCLPFLMESFTKTLTGVEVTFLNLYLDD